MIAQSTYIITDKVLHIICWPKCHTLLISLVNLLSKVARTLSFECHFAGLFLQINIQVPSHSLLPLALASVSGRYASQFTDETEAPVSQAGE